MRPYFWLIGLCLLLAAALSAAAQDSSPPLLATNTPLPPTLSSALPQVAMERYALRTWREPEFVDLLRSTLANSSIGALEHQRVLRLLQYELLRRFPDAPSLAEQRDQLLAAAFAARPGLLDLRPVVRPAVEAILNQTSGLKNDKGFFIEILPANLDSQPPLDAVLSIRFPAAGSALYQDYVPALIDVNGRYRILDESPLLAAAPFGDVQELVLVGIRDFNRDGVDELAVALRSADLNQELRIFGVRGGQAASLVVPGEEIAFGLPVDEFSDSELETIVYRLESDFWQCLSEQRVTWRWIANFFRPERQGEFTFQSTSNCLFYNEEPLFQRPLRDAIRRLETLLMQPAAPGDRSERARMVLAMLYLFDGQRSAAQDQAHALVATAEPGSWVGQQAAVFLEALARLDATALTVCAALASAHPDSACSVDHALERIFAEQPLSRDTSLESQLRALGIRMLDQFTVSEIGRADRIGVRFDLAGVHWWSFAALGPDVYSAAPLLPPPGYETASAPVLMLTPPPTILDALLLDDDPAQVLTILDNLQRANPGTPSAPDLRYVEALSHDVLGSRERARAQYFALWRDYPSSIWGQLAAAHLEQR